MRWRAIAIMAMIWLSAGCRGATWYVNYAAPGPTHDGTSWASAFTTIQGGINAAQSGDSLWVARGTYLETLKLRSGISILGGFTGVETSAAQRNPAANRVTVDAQKADTAVSADSTVTTLVTVDGILFQNGRSLGYNDPITGEPQPGAGGGFLGVGANVAFSRCTFAGNEAGGPLTQGIGGAVYVDHGAYAFDRCTFRDNLASADGGLYALSAIVTLTRCTLTGNSDNAIEVTTYVDAPATLNLTGCLISGHGGYAVLLSSSYWGTFTGVPGQSTAADIEDNVLSGNGGGISCADAGTGISAGIYNNTIAGGILSPGHSDGTGLELSLGYYVVANNIIAQNQGAGIWSNTGVMAPSTSLYANDVFGNSPNVKNMPDPAGARGNVSADPMFANAAASDWHLTAGSPCIDAGIPIVVRPTATDADGRARIIGASVDIGAYEFATVVFVDRTAKGAGNGSSWADAFTSIGAAMAVAYRGDVWVVDAGTYTENVALKDGVGLYGGFAGTETTRDQRNPIRRTTISAGGHGSVITADYTVTHPAVLDGFVLTGGTGNASFSGAGIASDHANIIVSHNTITGNSAVGGSGGGASIGAGSAAFLDNVIRGNTATSSGGAIAASSATLTLTNNLIVQNTTNYPGSSSRGGALELEFCNATFVNNTIVDNTAGPGASNGGAISSYSGSLTLSNNIIAYNSSGLFTYWPAQTPASFSHNDIFGNAAYDENGFPNPAGSSGNIAVDPAFASHATGDYHLAAGSPCAGAGDDTAAASLGTDLDGGPRRAGDHVDIGAYELPASLVHTPADARLSLSFLGGLAPSTASDMVWLNVDQSGTGLGQLDLRDAVRLVRMGTGPG